MEVITNLFEETIRSMREVGLVESYIKTLGYTWNAFDRWLAEKGLSYDPSLGWTFLSEEYGIEGPGGRSKTRAEQMRRRAVTAHFLNVGIWWWDVLIGEGDLMHRGLETI